MLPFKSKGNEGILTQHDDVIAAVHEPVDEMQAVTTFYGAPTGAQGAGAPRRGNAGGPRQTPWPCIAMCTTLIRGGPHLRTAAHNAAGNILRPPKS